MYGLGLKEKQLIGRIELALSILFQLAICWVGFLALVEGRWEMAFTAICVLCLTFVPNFIEKKLKVFLPIEFTFVTCIFLYAAYALGEFSQFYEKVWWWDLMLHSFSALVMGLIGFLMIYVFYMTNKIRISPVYVAIITFSLAVTVGLLWEVFEFLMDYFFGTSMQKSGLVDTMTDLIVDMAGALLAAILGYRYVKGGDSFIATQMISLFVHKNPHIFKNEKTNDS